MAKQTVKYKKTTTTHKKKTGEGTGYETCTHCKGQGRVKKKKKK